MRTVSGFSLFPTSNQQNAGPSPLPIPIHPPNDSTSSDARRTPADILMSVTVSLCCTSGGVISDAADAASIVAQAKDGAAPCYRVDMPEGTVYVAPLRTWASRLEALCAAAASYGGGRKGLARFFAYAAAVFPMSPPLGEAEFCGMVRAAASDAGAYAVGGDAKAVAQKAAAARAGAPALVPLRVCVESWEATTRVDQKHRLTLTLAWPPPPPPPSAEGEGGNTALAASPFAARASVSVRPHCDSHGVSFEPPVLELSARAPSASFAVRSVRSGAHWVRFGSAGAGAAWAEVLLPAPVELGVLSHEEDVIEGAVDTLALMLGVAEVTCEDHVRRARSGGGDAQPRENFYIAFRSAVATLLHDGVALSTLLDMMQAMITKGLFGLLSAVVEHVSVGVVGRLCNESVDGTPLCHWFVVMGDMSCIARCLECYEFRDQLAASCVAVALRIDDPALAHRLLAYTRAHTSAPRIDVASHGRHGGTTVLCTAVRRRFSDVVTKLLAIGADVNETDADGCTPLHYCYTPPHDPSCPQRQRHYGWTPDAAGLQLAEAIVATGKVEWEGTCGRRNASVLTLAASLCCCEGVASLLKAGFPAGRLQETLLACLTSERGRTDPAAKLAVARLLTRDGIRHIDSLGPTGCTALQAACSMQDEAFVTLLLERGADARTPDATNRNCLHYLLAPPFACDAAQPLPLPPVDEWPSVQRRLRILEAIADDVGDAFPNMDTLDRASLRTPLHLACSAGMREPPLYAAPPATAAAAARETGRVAVHTPLVERLVAGRFVATLDKKNMSPFHCAVVADHVEEEALVTLLPAFRMEQGLSPEGRASVLHIAAACGLRRVVAAVCERFHRCEPETALFSEGGEAGNTALVTALLYSSHTDPMARRRRRLAGLAVPPTPAAVPLSPPAVRDGEEGGGGGGGGGGGAPTPTECLSDEDRSLAEDMALKILQVPSCSMTPMLQYPHGDPLQLAAARRYLKVCSELIHRRGFVVSYASAPCTGGGVSGVGDGDGDGDGDGGDDDEEESEAALVAATPLSAVLGVGPYDTPHPCPLPSAASPAYAYRTFDSGDRDVASVPAQPSETETARAFESKRQVFRLLVTQEGVDESTVIAVPEAASGGRTILQILCDQCEPEMLDIYVPAAPLQWEWSPDLGVDEHPLCLALASQRGGVLEKDTVVKRLLPFTVDHLRSIPAVLMMLCKQCIELGLDEVLASLISVHGLVTDALLSGGLSLLQYAITSRSLRQRGQAVHEAVCLTLLRAGVDPNVVGSCGTSLQEAVKHNLWGLVERLCDPRSERKANASIATQHEPTPPIALCLEKASRHSVEATSAILSLLGTKTVTDLVFGETSTGGGSDAGGSGRVRVADVACSKGLASLVMPLTRAGLLAVRESAQQHSVTTLAHRAVTASIRRPAGAAAAAAKGVGTAPQHKFGPAATLEALGEIGYLQLVLETKDENGHTPLKRALHKGVPEAAAVLIRRGARTGWKDGVLAEEDPDPLGQHVLCSGGTAPEDESARACLDLLLAPAGGRMPYANALVEGTTMLHRACALALHSTLTLLLQLPGIQPNVRDGQNMPPLMVLMRDTVLSAEQRTSVLRTLYSHPDLSPTADSASPLHVLLDQPDLRRVDPSMLAALLRLDAEAEPAPQRSVVEAVIEAECVLQRSTRWLAHVVQRDPAYAEAAMECFQLVAEAFFERRPVPESNGSAAAYHALSKNLAHPCTIKAARLLLSHGLPCSEKGPDELTPLQRALASLKQPEPRPLPDTAKVLCAFVAARDFDPMVRDAKQRTLLHMCFELPHEELMATMAETLIAYHSKYSDVCSSNAVDLREIGILSQLTKAVVSAETFRDVLCQLLQLPDLQPRLIGLKGSILHHVCTHCAPGVVDICLESPAVRPHVGDEGFWMIRDGSNRTALECALHRADGVAPVVRTLLRHAAVLRTDSAAASGLTPLLTAVERRHWAVAEEIAAAEVLQSGNAVLSASGSSPLHLILASVSSPQEAVRWIRCLAPAMVKAHGTLAVRDAAGDTLLHAAARRAFTAAAVLLARTDAEDPGGEPVAVCAGLSPFAENGARATPLHAAAALHVGFPAAGACVAALLRAAEAEVADGAELRARLDGARDDEGRTVLMAAAASGHSGVCLDLIRRGCSLRHVDRAGKTVLHHAFSYEPVAAEATEGVVPVVLLQTPEEASATAAATATEAAVAKEAAVAEAFETHAAEILAKAMVATKGEALFARFYEPGETEDGAAAAAAATDVEAEEPGPYLTFRSLEYLSLRLLRVLRSNGCAFGGFVHPVSGLSPVSCALAQEQRRLACYVRQGGFDRAAHRAAPPAERAERATALARAFATPIPAFLVDSAARGGSEGSVWEGSIAGGSMRLPSGASATAPAAAAATAAAAGGGSSGSPTLSASFLRGGGSGRSRASRCRSFLGLPASSSGGGGGGGGGGSGGGGRAGPPLLAGAFLSCVYRTTEPALCLALMRGVQVAALAAWLQRFGAPEAGGRDGDVAEACAGHLAVENRVDARHPTLRERWRRYASRSEGPRGDGGFEATAGVPEVVRAPEGCGERLCESEVEVFLRAVERSPDVLGCSRLLANRFCARLLHARLGLLSTLTQPETRVLLNSTILSPRVALLLPPLQLMLLASASSEAHDALFAASPPGLLRCPSAQADAAAAASQMPPPRELTEICGSVAAPGSLLLPHHEQHQRRRRPRKRGGCGAAGAGAAAAAAAASVQPVVHSSELLLTALGLFEAAVVFCAPSIAEVTRFVDEAVPHLGDEYVVAAVARGSIEAVRAVLEHRTREKTSWVEGAPAATAAAAGGASSPALAARLQSAGGGVVAAAAGEAEGGAAATSSARWTTPAAKAMHAWTGGTSGSVVAGATDPSAPLTAHFFRRPLAEQTWELFETMYDHRVPMCQQALCYMLEEGRVGRANVVGDTVLHVLALNDQRALLSAFLEVVPHLGSLDIDAEAHNVFGKTAAHYASFAFLQPLSQVSQTARLARRYEGISAAQQQQQSQEQQRAASAPVSADDLLRRLAPAGRRPRTPQPNIPGYDAQRMRNLETAYPQRAPTPPQPQSQAQPRRTSGGGCAAACTAASPLPPSPPLSPAETADAPHVFENMVDSLDALCNEYEVGLATAAVLPHTRAGMVMYGGGRKRQRWKKKKGSEQSSDPPSPPARPTTTFALQVKYLKRLLKGEGLGEGGHRCVLEGNNGGRCSSRQEVSAAGTFVLSPTSAQQQQQQQQYVGGDEDDSSSAPRGAGGGTSRSGGGTSAAARQPLSPYPGAGRCVRLVRPRGMPLGGASRHWEEADVSTRMLHRPVRPSARSASPAPVQIARAW